MTPQDSAADILIQIIAGGGLGIARPVSGQSGTPWQITVGFMPATPVDRVSLVDTSPMPFGRNQRTKETEEALGVIVYLRANDYLVGWGKLKQITDYLDTVQRQLVTLRGRTYRVWACKRTSGPMFIGQEENQTASNFTLNYLLTISRE